MKLLIINGPNLNMLGYRDKNIYGKESYDELVKGLMDYAGKKNISLECVQSNYEGKIIDHIQNSIKGRYAGVIINPGAYTHYSYAIRDALEMVNFPKVEVHISNIKEREDFRKISLIEDIVDFSIIGKGLQGYYEAIDFILHKLI